MVSGTVVIASSAGIGRTKGCPLLPPCHIFPPVHDFPAEWNTMANTKTGYPRPIHSQRTRRHQPRARRVRRKPMPSPVPDRRQYALMVQRLMDADLLLPEE